MRDAGRRLLCAALLVALLAPARAEDDPEPLGSLYRDRPYGYALALPPGFASVWVSEDEPATLRRFRHREAQGAALGTPPVEVAVLRAASIDDLWGPCLAALRLARERRRAVEAQRAMHRPIASADADPWPGRLWRFEVGAAYPERRLRVTLAAYQGRGHAFAVLLTCPATEAARLAPTLAAIVASFRGADPDARRLAPEVVLRGVGFTPPRAAHLARSIHVGWDVEVGPRERYLVLYDRGGGVLPLLARRIAHDLDILRREGYERDLPPSRPAAEPCVVRVFADARGYHAYGGPTGTMGHFDAAEREVVLYDASRTKKPDPQTLAMAYANAWYAYGAQELGHGTAHPWFTVGHAEYYAGAHVARGHLQIETSPWRALDARSLLHAGPRTDAIPHGHEPLATFVRQRAPGGWRERVAFAAQAWSLVWFLRQAVPQRAAWEADWGQILPRYVAALRRSDDAGWLARRAYACAQALDGVDLEALQAAWAKEIARVR